MLIHEIITVIIETKTQQSTSLESSILETTEMLKNSYKHKIRNIIEEEISETDIVSIGEKLRGIESYSNDNTRKYNRLISIKPYLLRV